MADRTPVPPEDGKTRRSRTIAVACATFVAAMVGAAYASVPLYDLFCKATGYGGTTKQVTSADGVQVVDRAVTVRFDANVAPGLPWSFKPDQRQVTLKLGEMRTVSYRAKNLSDKPTTGTATFNVTPGQAGAYFSKIACFCFTEQTLQPGEEIEMGVTFYVDPAMLDDDDSRSIRTITLSYTFFHAREAAKPVADATPATAPRKL